MQVAISFVGISKHVFFQLPHSVSGDSSGSTAQCESNVWSFLAQRIFIAEKADDGCSAVTMKLV